MNSYIRVRWVAVVWTVTITMFFVAAGRQFAAVPHAQESATVWDGVYTDEQAKRGQTVYTDECAACHGETPGGTGMAPGLIGDDFMADFANSNVGELASRISQTMPANEPGKLKAGQVADVIAYLAAANKWPAGMKEIPTDAAAQKQIRIVKKQ